MAWWYRQLMGLVNARGEAGHHRWAAPRAKATAAAGALFMALGTGIAEAGEPAAAGIDQKGQYTLFNPTPDRLLRDLTTDRPDATETPFTVDAGHIQFETSLFGHLRSRPDVDGTVTDAPTAFSTSKPLVANHSQVT